MLEEKDIRERASEQSFQRGRSLYRMGNVQELQIDPVKEKDKEYDRILATVQGSTGKNYKVTATVEKENGAISSYICECKAYARAQGLCKHCVAALLRYRHVQESMQKRLAEPVRIQPESEDRVQTGAGDKAQPESFGIFREEGSVRGTENRQRHPTDPELYDILMQNGIKKQQLYREKDMVGQVRLYPTLVREYGDLLLTLKIGITQKYILGNLLEFSQLVREGGFKRYGRKLEFTHQLQFFAPESRPIVQYLVQLVEDNNTPYGNTLFSGSRYRYSGYYGASQNKRDLPMTGSRLDRFLELMQGQPINVMLDAEQGEVPYLLEDREPTSVLQIEGTQDGVVLRSASYPMFQGAAYQYIFRLGVIYRVTGEALQQISAFRDYMNRNGRKGCYIARRDLPLFCRDMLPLLQEHYKVEEIGFSSADYLPEPVSFQSYLDLEEGNRITCQLLALYGNTRYNAFSGEAVQAQRDIAKEAEAVYTVRKYLPQMDANNRTAYGDPDADQLYDFLENGLTELASLGEIFVSDALKRLQILNAPRFQVGVSMKGDLLELSISSETMSPEQLREILSKYDRKKKYYRLKSGEFLKIEEEEVGQVVELLDHLHVSSSKLGNGTVTLPKYRALLLEQFSDESAVSSVNRSRDFRALIRNMKSVGESEYEVPESLKSVMRSYQKVGFRWLETLHHNGFGGILADDMGLGKTLQIIAFLLAEQTAPEAEGKNRRALIVTPASLVYNWQNELEHFAPQLHAVPVVGSAEARAALIAASRGTPQGQRDILITSYDLLKRDIEAYSELDFFCEVIDEAQFIKNQATQAARAVKKIKAGTYFALTGTPVENRLSELWSIFDYLMPGFLFSYSRFREEIELPVTENKSEKALQRLHRYIAPFVLRRLKKDVLKDLPDKIEEVVYTKLGTEQQELYDAHVQRIRMQLDGQSAEEFRESRIQILAALTRLRQLCCTPALLYENFTAESAKVTRCMEMISGAVEGGHKVLVFSQFTSMLELLADEAEKLKLPYYMLTGQTDKARRMEMVAAFQQDSVPVFFISLKAGGTGLNLTSADIVIHFDPWWNLAAQNQATDRTHRIGQKNVVTVYKLIAKDTIEEKILQMQEKKQLLADQVLGAENMAETAFSKEELLQLLQ